MVAAGAPAAQAAPSFSGSERPTYLGNMTLADVLRPGASHIGMDNESVRFSQGLTEHLELELSTIYEWTRLRGKYLLMDGSNLALTALGSVDRSGFGGLLGLTAGLVAGYRLGDTLTLHAMVAYQSPGAGFPANPIANLGLLYHLSDRLSLTLNDHAAFAFALQQFPNTVNLGARYALGRETNLDVSARFLSNGPSSVVFGLGWVGDVFGALRQ